MATADVLKVWLPPAAVPIVRRLWHGLRGTRPEWEYVGTSWRAPPGGGWADPSVAATERARWDDFAALLRAPGPLGVVHEAPRITGNDIAAQNTLLAFAYVVARAGHGRERVAVLDWGGGMGHYGLLARATSPELALDYTVVDLPSLCAAGRTALPEVAFVEDGAAALGARYDLVVASSSLQYTEHWRALLDRLAAASRVWLYLTRIPLVTRAPTHVVVQRPHRVGYATEYVGWVFNRAEFLTAVAATGAVLEREFLIDGAADPAGAPEPFVTRGFLFRAR